MKKTTTLILALALLISLALPFLVPSGALLDEANYQLLEERWQEEEDSGALSWLIPSAAAQPAQWANRLGMVRRFALYCSANDPRTTVPLQDLLPHRYHRPDPYLYRDEEITRLLEAAGRLPPASGLRPHTFTTLFGLYAATGLRANEPLRLDRDDVDLDTGVLTIRLTKFNKSRRVPLHRSTLAAVRGHLDERDRLYPRPVQPSLFVSTTGTRLADRRVRAVFADLVDQSGLKPRFGSGRPTIHSLRHSFAVATLLDWYRDGADVASRMPLLSAYLGHVSPASTYWYLQATPELLSLAAQRLDAPVGVCS